MVAFGVLLPDLLLLADEGDELPGRLRPRFWPRTAFCCCAIIRDDVMVISRCCDSLQTFICVLVTCMCFLYPSTLFVVIFPSHGLWFTYEVGCIAASVRAEAEDDIRSNSQTRTPNDANLQDLLDRVSIDPHNHPSHPSKIDHGIRPLGRTQHR